jgi:hypothetical protein
MTTPNPCPYGPAPAAAAWHLLATRHDDGTVTTLCSKTHWRETPAAYGAALGSHCHRALRQLNSAVQAAAVRAAAVRAAS